METKFQTSFIPKKPMLAQISTVHSRPTMSIFTMFSVLVFILSIAGAGFVVLWQNHLQTLQNDYEQTLKTNENQFNPDLIATLQRYNNKVDTAQQLLASHIEVSQIFNIIAALTAQNISFSSLSFTAPITANDPALISMKGQAQSFSDIAFQSDVFGSSIQYGTQTRVVTPVLSNLSLDQNGSVGFTFTAGISPSDILYSKFIQ